MGENSSQQLSFLFFVLVTIFFTNSTSAVVADSPQAVAPEIPADHGPNADNQTVYRVSKALCWGCVGEALEFLFAHNMVRAAHGEFPMVWDSRLEQYARWWAGQRQRDCKLQHSFPEGGFTLGENIFWGSGQSWTPLDAVATWAGEEKYYSYAGNACQQGQLCGHYTQIVWRSTWRLGCARVVCDGGDVFMTCNYDPPGNYVGERPY